MSHSEVYKWFELYFPQYAGDKVESWFQNAKGQLIFGILLGILTGIFRLFGGSAEGVSYAIIFCNLLVPLIERVTTPTAFGKGGKK